jgi:hypothetical protein
MTINNKRCSYHSGNSKFLNLSIRNWGQRPDMFLWYHMHVYPPKLRLLIKTRILWVSSSWPQHLKYSAEYALSQFLKNCPPHLYKNSVWIPILLSPQSNDISLWAWEIWLLVPAIISSFQVTQFRETYILVSNAYLFFFFFYCITTFKIFSPFQFRTQTG